MHNEDKKHYSFKNFVERIHTNGKFQRLHQKYLEKKAIKYKRRNLPETVEMLKKYFQDNVNEKKGNKNSN